jgi:hypothetical protein
MTKIVIYTRIHHNDLDLVSLHDTLPDAKLAAKKLRCDRPFFYFAMLDLLRLWRRDAWGRKVTRQDIEAERMIWAFQTQTYAPGAEIVGLDDSLATPVWHRTLAEYEQAIIGPNGDNDLFLAMDREYHARIVRIAHAWGKPVPAAVLADYPTLHS